MKSEMNDETNTTEKIEETVYRGFTKKTRVKGSATYTIVEIHTDAGVYTNFAQVAMKILDKIGIIKVGTPIKVKYTTYEGKKGYIAKNYIDIEVNGHATEKADDSECKNLNPVVYMIRDNIKSSIQYALARGEIDVSEAREMLYLAGYDDEMIKDNSCHTRAHRLFWKIRLYKEILDNAEYLGICKKGNKWFELGVGDSLVDAYVDSLLDDQVDEQVDEQEADSIIKNLDRLAQELDQELAEM